MVNLKRQVWLFSLIVVPGLLWAQGRGDSLDIAGKVYTLENCVTHFEMEKSVPTSAGYQFWFVDKDFLDGRTLKLSAVAPNQATHAPHQHAEDEFFFVLQGKAEFILDDSTAQGAPYTSFYCPPNRLHGIRNAGADTLKYLVIKKYEAGAK